MVMRPGMKNLSDLPRRAFTVPLGGIDVMPGEYRQGSQVVTDLL